jgi:hypothetical protein
MPAICRQFLLTSQDPVNFVTNDPVCSAAWCIFLTIFIKFTKLTNYCWMLCEGLYLYRMIVRAFREQNNSVRL